MLDPRIYRMGLVAVGLAVMIFAFSLTDQPGGPETSLAPDAFNAGNAYVAMAGLAHQHPDRLPGSSGDQAVADVVAGRLRSDGFSVRRSSFRARTAQGTRTLENVIGTLAGGSNSTIVVVSHRDAAAAPSEADLSGTAIMLELARVLSGETVHHSFVLASTTGSVGAVGAARLASEVPGPVDAVIVLGDLAAARPHEALVSPWSRGQVLAPPQLRNTVAWALGAQAGAHPQGDGLAGQLLHLAFPITVSEQAPFDAAGIPAVLLSLAGERGPAANEPVAPGQVSAMGRTVLDALNALDAGVPVPAPEGYLLYDNKVIPAWSVRLLVLALILPVVLTAIDGLARARRRKQSVLPWLVWVLACALAFGLGAVVVVVARLVGALAGAPGGPVPAGLSTPHAAGVITLILSALAVLVGLVVIAPRLSSPAGAGGWRASLASRGPGAGIAVACVLCVTATVMWVVNPFAAALLVPALHLWLWLGAGELALPRPAKVGLALLGALAPAAAVLYYAVATGLSPLGVLWNGVLMLAGGQIGPASVVLWSAALGCFATVLLLALRSAGRERQEPVAVTVRGPVSYAGPGSLGGTSSALRRP